MARKPHHPFWTRFNYLLIAAAVALIAAYSLMRWQESRQVEREAAMAEHAHVSMAPHDDVHWPQNIAFTLVDPEGHQVTAHDLRGRLALVTFGFTSCPDVCPTRLQDMTLAVDALTPAQASQLQMVFISIDPARDTPSAMKSFAELYANRFRALTGSAAQVDAAAKAFHVYYKKGEDMGDGAYMMDHSTQIFLLDRQGKVIEMFGASADPSQIASKLRASLGG